MKTNIYLILITALIFSCESPNAVQIDDSDWSGTISATDERNALMNSFTDAYENKDAEGMLSIFAEDAIFHVNDTQLTAAEVTEAFCKDMNILMTSKILIGLQLPCFIIMVQFIPIIGIHGMEPIKNR